MQLPLQPSVEEEEEEEDEAAKHAHMHITVTLRRCANKEWREAIKLQTRLHCSCKKRHKVPTRLLHLQHQFEFSEANNN
jgi:hypothetical protein